MIRRPPRSTQSRSSAASDVYKRQLQDDAGHGQLRADQAGEQNARHADLPEDRVLQVAGDRPRRHEVPELIERQRDRSQDERQYEADDKDACREADARPDACARQARHGVAYASEWIILASSWSPCARRGPGRAMRLS